MEVFAILSMVLKRALVCRVISAPTVKFKVNDRMCQIYFDESFQARQRVVQLESVKLEFV